MYRYTAISYLRKRMLIIEFEISVAAKKRFVGHSFLALGGKLGNANKTVCDFYGNRAFRGCVNFFCGKNLNCFSFRKRYRAWNGA